MFNYVSVMFHFGNGNPSEYLGQTKFNTGNDYMGDRIAE